MKVSEVMSRNVEVIRPDDTLASAAELMRTHDIGAIPVCNGDKVIGMITDRDIVVRGVARHLDPDQTLVERCCSTAVQWCFDDMEVDEAAERMEQHQIRRLIVVSHDKKLVGMLSLGDISGATSERRAGEVLETISEPASQQ